MSELRLDLERKLMALTMEIVTLQPNPLTRIESPIDCLPRLRVAFKVESALAAWDICLVYKSASFFTPDARVLPTM